MASQKRDPWFRSERQHQNCSDYQNQIHRHHPGNTTNTKKEKVQLKCYRQIIGKLWPVARIMPSTKGMFSPINKALKNEPACIGLGKDSEVLNLAVLVSDLSTQAAQVKVLVPGVDHYVGYCDACATGAGGIWMSGNPSLRPIVRRINFPHNILSQVVSNRNPRGCLANLDLELAVVLLQYMILIQ
jgi:hypothetical protein